MRAVLGEKRDSPATGTQWERPRGGLTRKHCQRTVYQLVVDLVELIERLLPAALHIERGWGQKGEGERGGLSTGAKTPKVRRHERTDSM